MAEKVYIVLSNLGGPNKKGEVRPFLFNLFYDKHIIPIPKFPRFCLAHLISFFRAGKSQKEYDKMGGFSPILQNTQKQAQLLQSALGEDFEVLTAMSYSYPFMEDVFRKIPKNAKKVILLPLYPQYSITTTQSSASKFCRTANQFMIREIDVVTNFYQNIKYIISCSGKIQNAIRQIVDTSKKTVVLFSAHGIPKDFITKMNDPYQEQINKTAELITNNLKAKGLNFESMVCFQSRVGPKEWLKPYIQDVLPKYTGWNVVVFPVAFVSEHLETLVELDHQYKELAQECGVAQYVRAQTPSECPLFIEALKDEVQKRL
jgi:protoporphyrin/coproporphyrin ferrochelatase